MYIKFIKISQGINIKWNMEISVYTGNSLDAKPTTSWKVHLFFLKKEEELTKWLCDVKVFCDCHGCRWQILCL